MQDIKKGLRDRVRDIRGLANALTYDADCLVTDIDSYDLICLGESIHETKVTMQRLVDNLVELEYQLYLIRRDVQTLSTDTK